MASHVTIFLAVWLLHTKAPACNFARIQKGASDYLKCPVVVGKLKLLCRYLRLLSLYVLSSRNNGCSHVFGVLSRIRNPFRKSRFRSSALVVLVENDLSNPRP